MKPFREFVTVKEPSCCAETKYEHVSSSDDRLQWVTTTGYTRLIADSTTQQSRKQRVFYFGLDTGTCTSADSYAGLASMPVS